MKKIIILFVAILFAATANVFAQNRVTILVDGIEEVKGNLLVAIYDSEATFLKKPSVSYNVKITKTTEKIIHNFPEGDYAIYLFQDVNGDGELDSGDSGIPIEKYGFSNNATIDQYPPKYGRARIFIDEDSIIKINLK